MGHKINQAWLLILLAPLFFYIAYFLAFFTHEYAHSFSAWIFGFKSNPLLLNFGDTSWENVLFFTKIDENVDFNLFSITHPWLASFIAFAGIGVGNLTLILISVKAIFTKKYHSQYYYYFFIWLVVTNLGDLLAYIPGRTFSSHGDIGEITSFLHISPWRIMIVFGYPICYCVWFFYSRVLPHTYKKLEFKPIQQIILLVMVTFTLFAFYGAAGYSGYGPESHLIAFLSIYTVPIVIFVCWPSRIGNKT